MSIEKEKELYRQMDLLQIKEVSTYRQQKNGTRIFELPILKYGSKIKVGSFKSGYVRRMNGGYTPYQLNKCEPNTEYYPERRWCEIQKTYCLKNYYINQANEAEDQKYTWSGGQITDNRTGEIYVHEQHAYWNKIPNSVQVIIDGHRYKIK